MSNPAATSYAKQITALWRQQTPTDRPVQHNRPHVIATDDGEIYAYTGYHTISQNRGTERNRMDPETQILLREVQPNRMASLVHIL
jgi:hypothetical protein